MLFVLLLGSTNPECQHIFLAGDTQDCPLLESVYVIPYECAGIGMIDSHHHTMLINARMLMLPGNDP